MTTRAAIYLRISLDAAMDGLAIDRQRQDCEALAEQRGWDVVRNASTKERHGSRQFGGSVFVYRG